MVIFYILAAQSGFPGSVALTFPGSLLEMQCCKRYLNLLNRDLHFDTLSRWVVCTLKRPRHHCWDPYHLNWRCRRVLSIVLGSWKALPPSSCTLSSDYRVVPSEEQASRSPSSWNRLLTHPFFPPHTHYHPLDFEMVAQALRFLCLLFPFPYISCFGGSCWVVAVVIR